MQITTRKDEIKQCIMALGFQRIRASLGDDSKANAFLSELYALADSDRSRDMNAEELAKCALTIATLNLSISEQRAEAYILRIGGKVQVEIGYKGWLILAKRAGILVRAYPVLEGDEFDFECVDFDQKVRFKPQSVFEDKTSEFIENNLRGIVVITKDITSGVVNTTICPKGLLIRLQNAFQNNTSPTYKKWKMEMWLAKAIKYALKRTPMDTTNAQIFKAFGEDDKGEIESVEAPKEQVKELEKAPKQNLMQQLTKNVEKEAPKAEPKQKVLNLEIEEGEIITEGNPFE